MSKFFIFLRKEFTENMRTKRFLVLACVYLFFAITAPLLTRFMGEFLGLFIPAGGDESMDLMVAAFSNAQWFESYAQLYGNLGQMGIFAVMFMYMNTIRKEVATGTASLMFSKGLGYVQFVLAKFTMAAVILFVITVISSLIAYVYTYLLFDQAGSIGHVLIGSVIFTAGSLMILAIIMLFSSIAKSSASSVGMTVGVYFIMIFATLIPNVQRFVPLNLLSFPVAVSVGEYPSELLSNMIIGTVIVMLALLGAVSALKRSEG